MAGNVDKWVAVGQKLDNPSLKQVEEPLNQLDDHMILRTYVVGYQQTPADEALYRGIRSNHTTLSFVQRSGRVRNVARWFDFLTATNPDWVKAANDQAAIRNKEKLEQSKQGGSYDIELPQTEGGYVTRFPPEPSGYLHIGHAKAALLNDYFAHEAKPGGTLICRFDDTNPSKEKQEYQDAIIKDLKLMGITPDRTTYSSDYFQEMYEYCVKMIQDGKAYADDTEQEAMAQERMGRTASRRRDAGIDDNLTRFDEMKRGSDEGLRWCIRAKIDFAHNNGALRDPVVYRCNRTPHHRTGAAWTIYPTYDFCVPILDAREGVTHALRTTEYQDRNAQYEWMQAALGLRRVHIWGFARMNFTRTLLSKRKLTQFVDNGTVRGWDDPRMPTIMGIRNRGMTIPALREFILRQGPSRNVVNMDWTNFWATNKRHVDPVAPRHTVVMKEHAVTCTVKGARLQPQVEERPKHPKNPELGMKKVVFAPTILIDQDDAQSFAVDEEITLMTWGNAIVRDVSHSLNPLSLKTVTKVELELHLQGDVKKTAKKITWLPAEGAELVPVTLVDFDFLITKDKIEEDEKVEDFLTKETEFVTEGLADEDVAKLQRDDIIEFQRKGFYRVDKPLQHGEPAVLFAIPSGKAGK